MSSTIIDHTLKSLDRSGRVIIARYREDCPGSERPRISIAHPGRAWAACAPTQRSTFCWWNVQMYSINGNAAVWQSLVLKLNLRAAFQALICFFSYLETHCITWAWTWLLISYLCQFKHFLHKNRWIDFHKIYSNWAATYMYTLYIYQNICKLDECIKMILCLNKTAITVACIDLPIMVHND